MNVFGPDLSLSIFGDESEEYDIPGEQTEALGPFWFVPGNGSLPGARDFPPAWLDWLLGYYDDPKATPWTIYDKTVAVGVPEGARLFYSPVSIIVTPSSGTTRRVGWVMIPDPPLYGAHKLINFKQAIRELPKERPEVLDLTHLRWAASPGDEEAVVFERGKYRKIGVPGREVLEGVWPNVLCVDAQTGDLLAIPYTSNVAPGTDLELVDGAPPYPLHLPSRGVNVVDIRFRGNKWKDRPYPQNDGNFWIYRIDGSAAYGPTDGTFTQAGVAVELDQAQTFNDRARVLRNRLGLGSTVSIAVLRYRMPEGREPGAYLVISCQYPVFTTYATGTKGPKDKLTLSFSRKVVIAVLKNAIPGVRSLDLERRPLAKVNPEDPSDNTNVAPWVAFKRSVICALEDWRSGSRYTNGAGDSGDAHERREVPNNKRSWFQSRNAGRATLTQAVDLLLFDRAQAQEAVGVLANGWGQVARFIETVWMSEDFHSPFDGALIKLASLLAPDEANPAFGLATNDPRWTKDPSFLLNIRERVLNQTKRGLREDSLEALRAWEEGCVWRSVEDPGEDCTFVHWIIFLSFCMSASQLPQLSVRDLRRF